MNEANTGAAITSLKVNGVAASISGKKITANLPFGTNLGQVKVDITASEMATVYNADGTEFNPEDNVYDLTSPIEFKVVSENGEFTNVYTLTATTAAQFSDVNTGDWFYQNVMDAVAAGIVSGRGDGTFGPMTGSPAATSHHGQQAAAGRRGRSRSHHHSLLRRGCQ